MKLTSIPPPLLQPQSAVSNIREAQASPEPASRISSIIPATSVSPSPTADESDTYARPRLVSRTFSNVISPADGHTTRETSSHLSNAIGRYSATGDLDPTGFMSRLAGMAGETSLFEGEVRRASISEEAAAANVQPDFKDKLRGPGETMEVQLRTADGDLVTIELKAVNAEGGDKALSFTMEVKGDLSEQELAAVSEAANGLGKVANRFFKDGEAALNELPSLENKALTGFTLELKDLNNETLQLEFNRSALEGNMQLKGEFNGYSFDVTRNTAGTMIGDALLENPQYQQYVKLIEESGQAYGTDSDNIRFMKEGLDAAFGVQSDEDTAERIGENGSVAPYLNDTSRETINNFASNLPDFEASFRSSVTVNPYRVTDQAFMTLDMSQSTELNKAASGNIDFTQKFNYEQTVQTFEALPGMDQPDLKGGNYVLQTLDRKEEVLRYLELDNGQPATAAESRKGEESLVREIKEQFAVKDTEVGKEGFDYVVDLLAQADALGEKSAEFQRDQLLNSETLQLFELAGSTRQPSASEQPAE